MLLGGAALTTIDAAAAYAIPMSDSNSLATLTVTAHSDNVGGRFMLSGRLTPNTAAGNCAENTAYLGWGVGSTRGAFHTASEGVDQTFFAYFDNPIGDTVDIEVQAQGGCTGPDGLEPNLQLTIAVDVNDLVSYLNDSITGVAYLGDDPAGSSDSYGAAEGVTVDLMDAALGATGTPVATDITGVDGSFVLVAPVDSQDNANRSYKIRFTYDATTVVYFEGGDVSAWEPSTSEWGEAADAGGPVSWFERTGYNAILSTATEPSATNTPRLCNDSESESIDSFDTASVRWEGICETDPTFFNAELLSNQMTAAFARFGTVWFDQSLSAYTVSADSFTTDETGGVVATTLHDDDIYLIDEDVTVDVTITRTFQGADTRWVIEVRDSATGRLSDVPFSFGGAFQNDLRTTWTRHPTTNGAWISDGGAARSVEVREAIVAHHAVAASFDLHTDLENIQLTVEGGELTYYLAVLDYTGCVVGAARTAALAIANDIPSDFGQNRAAMNGDACTVTWPAPSVDPMTVGIPFDQTFTVDSSYLGWFGGGTTDAENLPDGLEFETLDDIEPGVAPRFRLHGTPTTAGPFDIKVRAMNAVFRQDIVHLVGIVQSRAQSAEIILNFGVGDQVAGATADVVGVGLLPDSTYDVVVESTPQIVGNGTIGADYVLQDTVIMPSGLSVGWHSITLSGTFNDGLSVTETLWLRIAVGGTLAQISPTAPAADLATSLPSTGADISVPVTWAFLLVFGGLALVWWHRRQSFRD